MTTHPPITMALIEKIIHRAIMRIWHTGMRKAENAKNVSCIAAADIMSIINQHFAEESPPRKAEAVSQVEPGSSSELGLIALLEWIDCREHLPTKNGRYLCRIYTDFGAYDDVLSWDNHDKIFRKYRTHSTTKAEAEVFDWADTLILWRTTDNDAAINLIRQHQPSPREDAVWLKERIATVAAKEYLRQQTDNRLRSFDWYLIADKIIAAMGDASTRKDEGADRTAALPTSPAIMETPELIATAGKTAEIATRESATSGASASDVAGMTCCEHGRFGDGHECMKQPSPATDHCEDKLDMGVSEIWNDKIQDILDLLDACLDSRCECGTPDGEANCSFCNDALKLYRKISKLRTTQPVCPYVVTSPATAEGDGGTSYCSLAAKPEPVSLEKCAIANYRAAYNPDYNKSWNDISKSCRDKYRNMTKAVLDAAGVAYGE